MRKISVIGIGVGDPGHVTFAAAKALASADVVFVPDKGDEKHDLKAARLNLCNSLVDSDRLRIVEFAVPDRDRAPTNYNATVQEWHARIAKLYAEAFARELSPGQTGALLVWGDPSLYDSTLRILERVQSSGMALDIAVYPGITAVQALCARHGVSLNAIGEAVLITTGRKLEKEWPANAGSVVVMLDGEGAFAGLDDDCEIFWGAYVGAPDEMLAAGRLGDMRAHILAQRAEARARKGWIMDIALLRRSAAVRS